MTEQTHFAGDGCRPEHLWPAPSKPPDRVRHSWRCARRAPLIETTKRDYTGKVWVVTRCTGCGESDIDSRMLDTLIKPDRDDPPDAA